MHEQICHEQLVCVTNTNKFVTYSLRDVTYNLRDKHEQICHVTVCVTNENKFITLVYSIYSFDRCQSELLCKQAIFYAQKSGEVHAIFLCWFVGLGGPSPSPKEKEKKEIKRKKKKEKREK